MTVASIDIGTNTVLLLIAKVEPTSKIIIPVVDKLSMPRVGKGLSPGGKIQDENLLRLYTILDEYCKIIKEHNCSKTFACATNAFRIAANQSEIVGEIKKIFNLDIDVINGETEALFSFLGALSNFKIQQRSLIIDIGGGSTEIIIGDVHSIKYRKSFPVGVVALSEKYFSTQPPSQMQMESMKDELLNTLSELQHLNFEFKSSIAVAGTPTTLSCIKNNIRNYDADLIDGSFLKPEEIDKMILLLSHLTYDEMQSKYGNIIEGREDIILSGTLILKQVVEFLNIEEVAVSTRGIRHGVIINYLNNC
jgi:exopolyphosphatase/guanosine-5'-triphosphate,3'-diphosphate pyrophosphatase